MLVELNPSFLYSSKLPIKQKLLKINLLFLSNHNTPISQPQKKYKKQNHLNFKFMPDLSSFPKDILYKSNWDSPLLLYNTFGVWIFKTLLKDLAQKIFFSKKISNTPAVFICCFFFFFFFIILNKKKSDDDLS